MEANASAELAKRRVPIKIESSEQLKRLIDALANELVNANIHFCLYSDLLAQAEEYSREYHQAWTFWSLTFESHLDAAIYRLCRIYDHNMSALSIPNLLAIIRENLPFFAEEHFRERLKGNAFVDSLAADARTPDAKQLEADEKFANNESNLDVKALTQLRNNYFSHRSAKLVAKARDIGAEYPLSVEKVGELLAHGMEILNRYSSLFQASSWSTQIVGHEDYRTVHGALREQLEAYDRAIDDEEALFRRVIGPEEA